MEFSDVLGLPHLKNHLITSADSGRIPHAQLFVGTSGSGTLPMAIAYARYLICNLNKDAKAQACAAKFNKLAHPDLYFAFPVNTSTKVKKDAVSAHYLNDWNSFLANNPYGNLYQWYSHIGIENKQGIIGVNEATDIVKSLSLKSFEGGYKVMLIWGADKMNDSAANKLLKLIEEPPQKTVFILITEQEDQILTTIKSRCQVLHFPPLSEEIITQALIEKQQCEPTEAKKIAHVANGDYNKALKNLNQDYTDDVFENWFIIWVRTAFSAKKNKKAIQGLLQWSDEITSSNRETQKNFLLYCLDFFRQALLLNYKTDNLVYLSTKTKGFELEKFAPFVHNGNILEIQKEIEKAIYHIERNGYAKTIFTDLSIRLTRLLHRKEIVQ